MKSNKRYKKRYNKTSNVSLMQNNLQRKDTWLNMKNTQKDIAKNIEYLIVPGEVDEE